LKSRTERGFLLVMAAAASMAGATVLVSCAQRPAPVRVSGQTVVAGSGPLAGVRVTLEVAPSDTEEETAIERVETLSDARGEFSINFQGHWKHASYRLIAEAPGFRKVSIDGADSLKSPVTLSLDRNLS